MIDVDASVSEKMEWLSEPWRLEFGRQATAEAFEAAIEFVRVKLAYLFGAWCDESAEELVHDALAAAEVLAQEGIEAEVIDLRTIRPYDAETLIASVNKTGRVVVATEAPKMGGLAAELSATLSEECFGRLKAPVVRVAGLDTPIPFSVPLEKIILPGKDDILAGVRQALK